MNKKARDLFENIERDIKQCNNRQLSTINDQLVECLKKYDHDSFLKNFGDTIKVAFSFTKRKKCLKLLEDIFDSYEKLDSETRGMLEKDLEIISKIYLDLWDRIKLLLGCL